MNKTFALSSAGPEKPGDIWLTPRSILWALGPFDLDPCAAQDRPWDCAAANHTIDDDGLTKKWHGFVWMNSPYSNVSVWMARLAEHGHGIALVFARTDTAWFHDSVWSKAETLFFLRGRVPFLDANGDRHKSRNAGSASVLVGYGKEARDQLRRCGLKGHIVQNRKIK